MDARITKARLANQLSYDWLKILISVAAVVVAVCVLFTSIATHPRAGQTYEIYAYSDVSAGADFYTLSEDIEKHRVFSYDILEFVNEGFANNPYASAAFTGRRSAGAGTSMFITDYPVDDGNEETEDVGNLTAFVEGYRTFDDEGRYGLHILLDTEEFFEDAAEYVAQYFGADWRSAAEPDEAKVREAFLARNGKDKRFKTQAAKEAGVEAERARLEKLRGDLLFLEDAFAAGTLSHKTVETSDGERYTVAISLAKLTRIADLVYYPLGEGDDATRATDELYLVLFNNGDRDGDLKYETVSLLRYFVEEYR